MAIPPTVLPFGDNHARFAILIKAVPRPSKKYVETVCCAGVTTDGFWKRLYPVRFRQLAGESQFRRWDLVSYRYRLPTDDTRAESCHVFEDTIQIETSFPASRRAELIDRLLIGSGAAAAERGQSLALIRPRNTRFVFKRKPVAVVNAEKALFERAGRQTSFLDAELQALDPSPFAFAFRFEDAAGRHTYQCGDWETQAMFRKWRDLYGEADALRRMATVYNDDYPRRGMAFAIGTVLKRPHIWQLLGVRGHHVPDFATALIPWRVRPSGGRALPALRAG